MQIWLTSTYFNGSLYTNLILEKITAGQSQAYYTENETTEHHRNVFRSVINRTNQYSFIET